MTPLDQAFPGFVQACASLYAALLPWSMALLLIGFIAEFWHGPLEAGHLVKFIVKLFLVVLLLARSHDLINGGQALVQQWVQRYVPGRPESVATRYWDKLVAAQNEPGLKNRGFLRTLFSSRWFEAIIFAVLTLVSWAAMGVLFLVYCVQRMALLLCWCLAPLLFPLLVIRPVSGLGLQHLLRILGILLWPLGLALAATFTDGLLDVATDPNFLGPSVAGSLGRGMMTLLAVAVVAVWVLLSTVLAPVYIQRLFTGSSGAATVVTQAAGLLTGAAESAWGAAPGGARRAAQGARNAAGWFHRWTHPDPPPSNAPPTPSLLPLPTAPGTGSGIQDPWQPGPSDPTGDAAASAIVEQHPKS